MAIDDVFDAPVPEKPGSVRMPMSPGMVAGKTARGFSKAEKAWREFFQRAVSEVKPAMPEAARKTLAVELERIFASLKLTGMTLEKAQATPVAREVIDLLRRVPPTEVPHTIMTSAELVARKITATNVTDLAQGMSFLGPGDAERGGQDPLDGLVQSRKKEVTASMVRSTEGKGLVEEVADGAQVKGEKPGGGKPPRTPKSGLSKAARAEAIIEGGRVKRAYAALGLTMHRDSAVAKYPTRVVNEMAEKLDDLVDDARRAGIKTIGGKPLEEVVIKIRKQERTIRAAKDPLDYGAAVDEFSDTARAAGKDLTEATTKVSGPEAKAATAEKAEAARATKLEAARAGRKPRDFRRLLGKAWKSKGPRREAAMALLGKEHPKLAKIAKFFKKGGGARLTAGAGIFDALFLLNYYLREEPEMERQETERREHYETIGKLEEMGPQRTTEDYLLELQMAEKAGRNPALGAILGSGSGPGGGGTPDVLGGIGQQLARGEILI